MLDVRGLLRERWLVRRAVFYGSQQLHNAYLDDAAVHKLSCSPAEGRLTANVFIV